MPNYVENHVVCANTDALCQLRDFNLIIPMPLSLDVPLGTISNTYQNLSRADKSLYEILQVMKKDHDHDDLERIIRRYRINEKLYACIGYYEWKIDNWGTKWNSCEYELLSDDLCRFSTAWSHPLQVIKALSRQFPNDTFSVTFAEEDIGCHAGEYMIKNSKFIEANFFDDHSKQAYDTALDLWGCNEDYEFDKNEGTYTCVRNV